jgi:hypothetical protein
MTLLTLLSDLAEDPQFFAAHLTEVAQRLDIPLDPSRFGARLGVNDDMGQRSTTRAEDIRRMRLATVS